MASSRKEIKFIKQTGKADCAIACLKMVTNFHKVSFAEHKEWSKKCNDKSKGLSLKHLSKLSMKLGFKTFAFKSTITNLILLECPFIAFTDESHYVVISKVTARKIHVLDPAKEPETYSYTEFEKRWLKNDEGVALVLEVFKD